MEVVGATEGHLSQLAKQLSCPICLQYLNKAVNLSCSHVFCSDCIYEATKFSSVCPLCKVPTNKREMRPAPHLDNMVSVYRKMEEETGKTRKKGLDLKEIPENLSGSRGTPPQVVQPIRTPSKNGPWNILSCPSDHQTKSDQSFSEVISPQGGQNKEIRGDEPFFWLKCKNEEKKEKDSQESDSLIHATQTPEVNPTPRPAFSDLQDDSQKEEASMESEKNGPKVVKRALNLENSFKKKDEREEKGILSDSSESDEDGLKSPKTGEITRKPVPSKPRKTKGKRMKISSKNDDNEKVDIFKPSCGFCGSAGDSKCAGPLMKIENGELKKNESLKQKQKGHSTGDYIHEDCLEWAPAVYFSGGKVRNLRSELNRASKLKCSSCSVKGAALGCWITHCRRSYHFPCAKKLPGCAWDEEKFVMLCPEHAVDGFHEKKWKEPKENLEIVPQKTPQPALQEVVEKSPQTLNPEWNDKSSADWVLCCSGVDKKIKDELLKFSILTGASLVRDWSPKVTHLITGVDEKGQAKRTLKYLCALLTGQWIVTSQWLFACENAKEGVEEDFYEIQKDIHEMSSGPMKGRIRANKEEVALFHGITAYFHGEYDIPSKTDLVSVLSIGGGRALFQEPTSPLEESKEVEEKEEDFPSLIVFFNDSCPKEVTSDEEERIMEERRDKAEIVGKKCGAIVLPHNWLLDSAAGCELLSTEDY